MIPGIEFDNCDTKPGKQGQFSNLIMRYEVNTCDGIYSITLCYDIHIRQQMGSSTTCTNTGAAKVQPRYNQVQHKVQLSTAKYSIG